MSEIILGFAGLTETGRRGSFGPRGVSTEVHYAGPVSAVNAALQTLVGGRWDVEYDVTNPPVGTLIMRSPDYGEEDPGTVVQTQFDLVSNLAQRSGWEHRRSLALTDAEKRTIRRALKNDTAPEGLTGNAATFYGMMLKGQDSFATSQFVFKLTQYFVNGAVLDIAYSDINEVYSSAALIAETNPTGIYIDAINECATSFLASTYGGAVPTGSTYGWLKQAPQLNNVSGNRSALTAEYWLECWSDYYYEV